MNNQVEKLKLWFNPERNFYDAYAPNGQLIESIKATIEDDLNGSVKATIELNPEIVNEKPETGNLELPNINMEKNARLECLRKELHDTYDRLIIAKDDLIKKPIPKILYFVG